MCDIGLKLVNSSEVLLITIVIVIFTKNPIERIFPNLVTYRLILPQKTDIFEHSLRECRDFSVAPVDMK